MAGRNPLLQAGEEVNKDFLSRVSYEGKNEALARPDPHVVFLYHEAYLANEMIAP
ncbi:MAG TPA: hypothetical protein GX517_01835 [Alicyclobacillus sp.]|nr:hypothetical protein [Alicyclobacillus sp.]